MRWEKTKEQGLVSVQQEPSSGEGKGREGESQRNAVQASVRKGCSAGALTLCCPEKE